MTEKEPPWPTIVRRETETPAGAVARAERLLAEQAAAPLTDAELVAIEERANNATPGPWFNGSILSVVTRSKHGRCAKCGRCGPPLKIEHLQRAERHYHVYPASQVEAEDGTIIVPEDREYGDAISVSNGEFVARARGDIPRLVAEVRRLSALKLYEVANGFMSLGPIRCLVMAESPERAIELARPRFEAISGSRPYPKGWMDLVASELGSAGSEWVGEITQ